VSNFATHRQSEILAQPALLRSIRDSLLHLSANIRKTALHCVLHCVHHLVSQRTSHKEIREAEIDAALRGLVQSRLVSPGSTLSAVGSPLFSSPFTPGLPDMDSKEPSEPGDMSVDPFYDGTEDSKETNIDGCDFVKCRLNHLFK